MMTDTSKLQKKILQLKKKKNALILAHYYAPLEVQDVADHVCDSFVMAKYAARAESDLIVVCGVRFMGESAKILSPSKTVLLPAPDAGCPMADMVTPEDVARLRTEHPGAAVMCYVNSSAAVKAVSDICCTSSSALDIARAIPEREIIFVPDRHLGSYVAANVPEKTFYLHDGYCPTHHMVTLSHVMAAKEANPGAVLAVHPECDDEVVAQADFVGSTSEILDFAHSTDASSIIIGTEQEIVTRLRRELPDKEVSSVKNAFVCSNMKKINLASLLDCLENDRYRVELPDEELEGALRSLERMVNIK